MQKRNRVVWQFIDTGCPCCNHYIEGVWVQRKRRNTPQKPKRNKN